MTTGVFAVAGAKGGVGKTTTSINLGAALSVTFQQSVVVLDLDLAMGNVIDFLDFDRAPDGPSLHDVLAGETPVEAATYEVSTGFFVVPSGPSLDGFTASDPGRIGDVVETLRDRYDVVVLDTAAGVSYESLLPYSLADGVVLVSTPRLAAMRDTEKSKSIADRLGTPIVGAVFTHAGTGNAPDADRLSDYLDVPLLGAVPEERTIPRAQDRGQPVVTADLASSASKAYCEIAERFTRVAGGHDDENGHRQIDSMDFQHG